MYNVQAAVYSFLKAHKVTELPLRPEELAKVCGCAVEKYSRFESELKVLGMWECTQRYKGMCFVPEGQSIILLSDELPSSERGYVIMHELAHHILGHVPYNGIRGTSPYEDERKTDEKEADLFAVQAMAPAPVLARAGVFSPNRIMQITLLDEEHARMASPYVAEYAEAAKHTELEAEIESQFHGYIRSLRPSRFGRSSLKVAIPAALALVAVFMGYTFWPCLFAEGEDVENSPSPEVRDVMALVSPALPTDSPPPASPSEQGSPPPTPSVAGGDLLGDEQAYYWTSSGKVYHLRADCSALRRSETIVAGTLEQAQATKERACKICGGDAE